MLFNARELATQEIQKVQMKYKKYDHSTNKLNYRVGD